MYQERQNNLRASAAARDLGVLGITLPLLCSATLDVTSCLLFPHTLCHFWLHSAQGALCHVGLGASAI